VLRLQRATICERGVRERAGIRADVERGPADEAYARRYFRVSDGCARKDHSDSMQISAKPFLSIAAPFIFFLLLGAVAWHSYHYPDYGIDMLGYMENIAALETSNVNEIHAAVYGEVRSRLPEKARDHLLGLDKGTPDLQNSSLQDRASNPRHFAEFLPCFAVRPLYIELLHLFHKCGASLVKATVLGAVLPYVALGALLFVWSQRCVGSVYASALAFLLAITPPVWNLSRMTEPDCMSTLWVCLALYLIFERNSLTAGLTVLLSSVYVRTDNVLLVLCVLAYLGVRTKQVDKWKAAVLAGVAVASVYTINHFAGDYGWRLLYYRGFIAPPIAPGEFVAHFSLADYERALRSGIAALINGNFVPYLFFGMIGYLASTKQSMRKIFGIVIVFSAMHFIIFPLALDRYLALYYVVASLAAISAVPVVTKHAEAEIKAGVVA